MGTKIQSFPKVLPVKGTVGPCTSVVSLGVCLQWGGNSADWHSGWPPPVGATTLVQLYMLACVARIPGGIPAWASMSHTPTWAKGHLAWM